MTSEISVVLPVSVKINHKNEFGIKNLANIIVALDFVFHLKKKFPWSDKEYRSYKNSCEKSPKGEKNQILSKKTNFEK